MKLEMQCWVRRNLPNTLNWSDGIQRVKVSLSDNWLCLNYYPSAHRTAQPISLDIELFKNSAKIADLKGNAEGTPYHNRKIGTLLVNLAIQTLRIFYADRLEEIILKGETCPSVSPGDASKYTEDIARRAYFWSRFGLSVADPLSARSSMSASLADLKIIDRGCTQYSLSTTLCITQFWRSYHEPRLYDQDSEIIKSIDIDLYELKSLADKEVINRREIQQANWASYPIYIYTIVLLVASAFLLIYPDASRILKALFVITAIATYNFITRKLFNASNRFLGLFSGLTELKFKRQKLLTEVQIFLQGLEEERPGVLNRFLSCMKWIFPESVGPMLCSDGIDFDRSHQDKKTAFLELGELVGSFKKQYYHQVNVKRMDESTDIKDFLFDFNSNHISIFDLHKYADLLDGDFEFHINRLLMKSSTNELYVSGNSNADPTSILARLTGIARIDFYTENCTYSNYGSFHMKVHLREGTLNFRPSWSAYKPSRIQEALPVLLHIAKRNLTRLSFIKDGESMISVPLKVDDFIYAIFDLTNFRTYSLEDARASIDRIFEAGNNPKTHSFSLHN